MYEKSKVYIVLLHDLPIEFALNTVALLSMGLAKEVPGLVGPEVLDSHGRKHSGICQCPVIIVKAKSASRLQRAYDSLREEGLCVVPFFEHSRELATYPEYQASMMEIPIGELSLSGFGAFGDAGRLRPYLKRFSLWN